MSVVISDILQECFTLSRIDRCLLSDKPAYVEYIQRRIDLQHRRFPNETREARASFVEDQPSRYLTVLQSVPGRLLSIHFGEGVTIMGFVESVDAAGGVFLSTFCGDGDGYRRGEFPFGGPCIPVGQYIPSDVIAEAWLIEVRMGCTKVEYLRDKTVVDQDPQRLQYLTDLQWEAFSDFQLLAPSCRLHGLVVYGTSRPDSDVDICVDHNQLDELAAMVYAGLAPFEMGKDLLHLRKPRLVLWHEHGTKMDVVGMDNYEEEKDHALCCVCQNVVYNNFLVTFNGGGRIAD